MGTKNIFKVFVRQYVPSLSNKRLSPSCILSQYLCFYMYIPVYKFSVYHEKTESPPNFPIDFLDIDKLHV